MSARGTNVIELDVSGAVLRNLAAEAPATYPALLESAARGPLGRWSILAAYPRASLWLDRDDSVLASLYWSTVDRRIFTANLYPDVLLPGLGAWVAVTRDGGFELGLSHRSALGLGIGAGWR